jgi:hypothetical protein
MTQDMVLGRLPPVANRPKVEVPQDCILGDFQPSLRDWLVPRISPQDCVLGYPQLSLRDSI